MARPNLLHIEALLGFDGTVIRFDGGYEIALELRRIEPSAEAPHGFRYSFVLRGPGAAGMASERIFGYDNAHAPVDARRPHDHLHKTRRGPGGRPIGVHRGVAAPVASIDELIGRFMDECLAQLNELGVDVGAMSMTTGKPKARKSRAKQGGRSGTRKE